MSEVRMVQDVNQVELAPKQKVNFKQAPVTAPAAKECGKDILLYLTTLASAAVAGIALYKNHGAQKELTKALEKLKTSENSMKKLAEETENKIKNAVDEALKNTRVGASEENALKEAKPTKNHSYLEDFIPVKKRKKGNTPQPGFADSAREGEAILADEEAVARKAKKASDRRNQEWVEKQHKAKEKEYNEFFEKHSFRATYLDKKATVRHFYNTKVATPVKEKFAQVKNFFSKKSA